MVQCKTRSSVLQVKMFTGIVETIGIILAVEPIDTSEGGGGGFSLTIGEASIVLCDVNLGDSINCNGVCLTVTQFNSEKDSFKVGISPETIRRTNLGEMKEGQRINLERAMNSETRFGGHYVQGHVDTTVTIVSAVSDPPNSIIYTFHVAPAGPDESDYLSYVVPKGYVALDGTSLTVINVDWKLRHFSIMLIAYTQLKVVMMSKDVGSRVNLEVDQMGKLVENVVRGMLQSEGGGIHNLIESTVRRILNENK